MALNGDDIVRLDKVWTAGRLPVLNRNIPCEENVKRWPHLRDIEFPEAFRKANEKLIGNDVPGGYWVLEQRRGGRRQPYAVSLPVAMLCEVFCGPRQVCLWRTRNAIPSV